MKKMLLSSFCFVICHSVSADIQTFSEKAQELLKEYAPYATPMAKLPFRHPPHNKEKHYTEEYRPAWEELYYECATNNHAMLQVTIYGVTAALSAIASTNSIPMLVDVYTQLFEINHKENPEQYRQERQKEILNILLTINDSTAFDAIFLLIDMTETKLGINFSTPLREMIIKDLEKAQKTQERFDAYVLEDPNAIINENRKRELKMASERQERFNNYQNSNLSERNQVFLQQARSLKRTQEGQNSD